MATLTPKQMRRLTKEARALASECAEGTAPRLIRDRFYSVGLCCVLGEVSLRAGLKRADMLAWFTGPVSDAALTCACANNDATDEDRHAAVVFPLMALADALEEAAK